jgi:hypothetical protein
VASRNLLALIDEAVDAAGDGSRFEFGENLAAIEDRYAGAVRDRHRIKATLGRREELEARVSELRRQIAVLDNPDLKERRERNERILRQRAELESIATDLNETIRDIRRQAERMLVRLGSEPPEPADQSSPRAPHARQLDDIRTRLLNDLLAATGHAEAAAKEAEAARRQGTWADEVMRASTDEAAYQAELSDMGVDPECYLGLREELSSAEQALTELDRLQERLTACKEDESEAWEALIALYDGRRHRRAHLVDAVRQRSGSLRFEFDAHGDWAGWERNTRELLNLRSDGFITDVREVAKWLWSGPAEEFAERLQLWRSALTDSVDSAYKTLERETSGAGLRRPGGTNFGGWIRQYASGWRRLWPTT